MTAIILAAGLSRRFGKDKLLMKIDRRTIVERVMESVKEMGFESTVLVYSHDEVRKLAEKMGMDCRYNAFAHKGQSTSIICGIQHEADTDAYIFFLGDQPFIDRETVNLLKKAYYEGRGSIIVPRYAGQRGNPVIFDSRWKAQLLELDGDTGGRSIIDANEDKVCYVDVENLKAGLDIDTWEEYINIIKKGDHGHE